MNSWTESEWFERRRNNEGYHPGNCVWATAKEQSLNTRRNRNVTLNGQTKPLAAWTEEMGLNYFTVFSRIAKYGWTPERALAQTTKQYA